jgi:HTH-type transcriptional regulator, transcriptional repressor of NAD biosynthesis genes
MRRGLVIGKFYPPHRGHHFLIETAARQVEHLDVLVCWKEEQDIPGEIRADWLREVHDNPRISVRTVWDFGDDDNSAAWAACAKQALGSAPDLVFTSEDYGDAFSGHLGAQHVLVDRAREHVPTSSTAIRAAPLRNWDFLAPPVRAWYAVRVAIVGAESSGTTTLARSLAEHYRTGWVPEFGREYCERFVARGESLEQHRWKTAEFVEIARMQLANEEAAARICNRLVICDTDVLATAIWHERYVGTTSEEVRNLADPRRYALYILTEPDIRFVQDGYRDGEHLREWMTARFRQELANAAVPWLAVSGTHAQRMQAAVAAVDRALALRGAAHSEGRPE